MKIKIACFKNACLERKFKTDEKFLLGRGGFGEGKKGKMPRKGVEVLEILRGGVQKMRKTMIFIQKKKNIIGQVGVRYDIICGVRWRNA